MLVGRAHSYADVEQARLWVEHLPTGWEQALDDAGVRWIILPDGLSPVWTGHALHGWRRDPRVHGLSEEVDYARVAGFTSFDPWGPWQYPYIYLNAAFSWWAAAHEGAHCLERLWHPPLDRLYRPELAMTAYGRENPTEYFAEALDAYVRASKWESLAERDPETYAYLLAREVEQG